MNPQNEDIKRWTARRKAEVVLDIIKGKTTSAEVASSHDLTVGEIEQWMEDFTSMGTEALRSHPRDAQALHNAREKELLAKIGDLTMLIEVYKIACEVQGKPLPDVRS
jgi:transposase-like protein